MGPIGRRDLVFREELGGSIIDAPIDLNKETVSAGIVLGGGKRCIQLPPEYKTGSSKSCH